jgi:hypothetical protein
MADVSGAGEEQKLSIAKFLTVSLPVVAFYSFVFWSAGREVLFFFRFEVMLTRLFL